MTAAAVQAKTAVAQNAVAASKLAMTAAAQNAVIAVKVREKRLQGS